MTILSMRMVPIVMVEESPSALRSSLLDVREACTRVQSFW